MSLVAQMLDISRAVIYTQKAKPSEKELQIKRLIDRMHTDNPAWGSRQLSSQLKHMGYPTGRKRTRRYMHEMGIHTIYPKPNLSKRLKQAQIMPYLLKNAVIDRPNQVWSIDITYIPMRHSFLYLTAIIDWYTRCIVGWELDDTLDTRVCIEACRKAFKVGRPEIINSDQGCQFTSDEYKKFIKKHGIRQSMDGKSRWADNVLVERWFRTFKYEEMYLTEWANIKEARTAIRKYIDKYNCERCHSSIGNIPPAEAYGLDKKAA